MIPRFLFDKFSDSDFSKLLTYNSEQEQVITLILETCKQYLFDGIVLEIWSQLAARVDDAKLIKFVSDIGNQNRKYLLQIYLNPFFKYYSTKTP